jgi:hypothetical protein
MHRQEVTGMSDPDTPRADENEAADIDPRALPDDGLAQGPMTGGNEDDGADHAEDADLLGYQSDPARELGVPEATGPDRTE